MNKLNWLGTIGLVAALSACGGSSDGTNVGGAGFGQGGSWNISCRPGDQAMGRLGCIPAGMDFNSACGMVGGNITFTNGQWICIKTMNYRYGSNLTMITPASPILRPDQPNRMDAALMNQGTANWVPNGMGGGGGYGAGGYYGTGGYYNNQLLVFPGDKIIYSGRGKWGLPEHGCSRHNFNGSNASFNNGQPQGLLMSTGNSGSMQLLGNSSGKTIIVSSPGALYVGLNIPQAYIEGRTFGPACALIEQAPTLQIQLCASNSGQPIACP